LEEVCWHGDQSTCNILIKAGAALSASALAWAARHGFDTIVQESLTNHKWSISELSRALDEACAGGNQSLCALLVKRGATVSETSVRAAVFHGFDVLVKQWLTQWRWNKKVLARALKTACHNDRMSTATLLFTAGAAPSASCIVSASEHGCDALVQEWLATEEWTSDVLTSALEKAAHGGWESTCRLLVNSGAAVTADCLRSAAGHGLDHLVREWLTKQQWSSEVLTSAFHAVCRREPYSVAFGRRSHRLTEACRNEAGRESTASHLIKAGAVIKY
jgi:hypothetical protein